MLARAALVLLCSVCLWKPDSVSWADQGGGLCRYGNSVECCWGWRRTDGGRCQSHCQQGCKHGECVGPDKCKCHPGYTGKACNQDLNECGVKPRPCKHRCMNTPGSYKCYCQDGYTAQPDGSCRNARTCYHANCQYGCEVIKGAVRCTCPSPGLRLGADRRTCVDIDECVLPSGVCPRRRKCVNTFGSFVCKCHLGFRLSYIDGRHTCVDKDARPFCSLNPASPKCRCDDGSCAAVLRVALEPQRPRSPAPARTTAPTSTTTPLTTATTTASTTTPLTTTTTTASTTTPLTTTTTTASTTTSTTTTTTAAQLTRTTAVLRTTPTTAITTSSTIPTATTAPIASTSSIISSTTPATATTAGTSTSIPLPTTTELETSPATTTTTTTTSTTTPTTATTTTTTPTTTSTTTPTTATTTTTTTTTPTTGTSTTPTTTVEPTVTMPSSTSLVTTTVNNRINKEVTHRQRGDVHIPRRPADNQVWEFDIELGDTAEDAGDDPEAGVLRCTFDHGPCDWMSDREGDLHWETVHNPAGGRYLAVPELKAGQRAVRGARLAVHIVPPWSRGDLCFSFSHWLRGHHVGVLQLFVRKQGRGQRYSPALWSRTGGHGWRHTQVALTTHSLDKVLLKAERRTGRRGQIAVDDVTLRQGACR